MENIETGQGPPLETRIADLLAHGAQRLRTAFADLFERRAWRSQFELWADRGETISVLEALGLEPGQVSRFVQGVPAAQRLLPAMLTRVGLAPRRDANLPRQHELVRVCALCPNQARCAEWLQSGATAGFEEFCPNAPSFAAASSARQA